VIREQEAVVRLRAHPVWLPLTCETEQSRSAYRALSGAANSMKSPGLFGFAIA